MKSYVRIKAYLLLIPMAVGMAQIFSFVPWTIERPVFGGLVMMSLVFFWIMALRCEECGVSPLSFAERFGKYGYEEQLKYGEELKAKTDGNHYRQLPFFRKCIHCGTERH